MTPINSITRTFLLSFWFLMMLNKSSNKRPPYLNHQSVPGIDKLLEIETLMSCFCWHGTSFE